jgi:DNA-binding PadR family transcriptional regulator
MPRPANASRQTRILLAEFATHPDAWRHGYDLTKATGIGAGTLYPTLSRLADQGLLESEWRPAAQAGRPARHAYRLTAEGLAFARRQAGGSPVATAFRPVEAKA